MLTRGLRAAYVGARVAYAREFYDIFLYMFIHVYIFLYMLIHLYTFYVFFMHFYYLKVHGIIGQILQIYLRQLEDGFQRG